MCAGGIISICGMSKTGGWQFENLYLPQLNSSMSILYIFDTNPLKLSQFIDSEISGRNTRSDLNS